MHKSAIAAVIGAGLCLSACAAPTPSALASNDPYEAANRNIFALNQKIDRLTLRRMAKIYIAVAPEPVRDSVHNTLTNLDLPVTFANDVLQGEPKRAGQTFSRLLVNSTLGVAGLFDVASSFGIPEHEEDFGQTLAVWGADEGYYLVLPLLGPAPPRDAAGMATDVLLDPTIYIHFKHHTWWMIGREYLTLLDLRARNMETLDEIERNSLDYYAVTRNLYRQHRSYEIRNGEPEPPPEN
jgi:phospholipid-binding lipoprotein MlaA